MFDVLDPLVVHVLLLTHAFQGLRGRELYVRAVQTGRAIPMQEFTRGGRRRPEKGVLLKCSQSMGAPAGNF